MKTPGTFIVVTAAMLCSASRVLGGELTLGSAQAEPGRAVTVPVIYSPGTGAAAAGLATDIRFNAAVFAHPHCELGSALTSGADTAKTVQCAEPHRGILRLAVYGLNLAPVPQGKWRG